VVEAAALEHGPGRARQGRPIEDLEGVKDRRAADLEEDVA
jgi:hypothetical protein